MLLQDFLKTFIDNKDTLTIIIASVGGLIAFGTFIKAILEYRLQGRQKRAELFDTLKNRLRTDQQLSRVTALLESDSNDLRNIPHIDKYYFLGFYEQVAVAVNSGLIKKNVAHYFFGYFAQICWKNKNFWYLEGESEINKNSYYWATFKKFVYKMNEIEKRRSEPNFLQGLYDRILYKRLYRF
jgi:hypothetical protein